MGIFDNVKNDSGKDEVEINVPEDDSGVRVNSSDQKESRLENEVESSLTDSSSSPAGASASGVSLDDIHSQNQRIIELLQRLVDQDSSSARSSTARGSSSVSSSSNSRSQENNENEMSGGLDGVL